MPRSLGKSIFLSSDRALPQTAFEEVSASDVNLKEDWFQRAIEESHELVIAPCIAGELTDDERWAVWGREIPVEDAKGNGVGSIDVLLVSETGRIAIVETKLSYNAESRRKVVAQVLDYATHLPEMTLDQLPNLPPKADQLVADHEDVASCLRAGDFLLIIAGDQLDSRALKLSQVVLDGNLTRRWSLAMVQLSLYRSTHDPSQLLVVPNLAGALVPEVRQHLRLEVVVSGAEKAEVTHSVRPVESVEISPSRKRWSEQRFFEVLNTAQLDERIKTFGRKLRELCDRHPSLLLDWGNGKAVGSATLKRNGASLIEFYLDGRCQFRPEKFPLALGASSERYMKGLRELFRERMEKPYPNIHPPQAAENAEALLMLIESVVSEAERS